MKYQFHPVLLESEIFCCWLHKLLRLHIVSEHAKGYVRTYVRFSRVAQSYPALHSVIERHCGNATLVERLGRIVPSDPGRLAQRPVSTLHGLLMLHWNVNYTSASGLIKPTGKRKKTKTENDDEQAVNN
jgi:hypothetical protein